MALIFNILDGIFVCVSKSILCFEKYSKWGVKYLFVVEIDFLVKLAFHAMPAFFG